MSSTKEIYWVCKQPSSDVWQKIHLLQKYHISVRILPDFTALMRNYAENRLTTILVGDEEGEGALDGAMLRLSNHPEYSGVRFILSLSKADPKLVQRAVDVGFRDIIPIDLSETQWLRRYAFASSGRPTELSPPHPQMSMQNLASIQIPGRIAWITEKELWLETRLLPPVGTELSLSGGLADLLGIKQVRLKVLNRYRSHLHFRYSEALLCRWEVAISHQSRKQLVRDFMSEQGALAQYRFYAVIRNRQIRNALVRKLPIDRFQLTVALNKNNMIQEPRFIAPDAVIIEDKMCLDDYLENFGEMLANLDPQIPVFIVGESARLVSTHTDHRLIPIEAMPADLPMFFEEHLGEPKRFNADASFIPKNHALSFGNINIPARILNLHPDSVEIASGLPLGRFGLFGMDAPIFQQAVQQKVHGKILDTWEGDHRTSLKDFPFHARAILVDLSKLERDRLGAHLVDLFTQQLSPKGQIAPLMKESPPALVIVRDPVDVPGPGPMRTEVSKTLRDPIDMPDQAPTLLAMETEIKPLEEQIVIERNYKENSVSTIFEGLWDVLTDFPKELKILIAVVAGISLALFLASNFGPTLEELGGNTTKQLKIYQSQHGGPQNLSPPSEEAH